jgi:cephalosporin-C deacetylase
MLVGHRGIACKIVVMAFFDLPPAELERYQPARLEPADFDAFWARTLAEARAHPLNARFERVDVGLRLVETYDVTFSGFGGQPIKGWLLLPMQRSGPLAGVVEFIGYGGGRNYPFDWLTYAAAGYAHLVMDTRGQGSAWFKGDTPDLAPDGASPHHPGFMTNGLTHPEHYYYRRLMTDTTRAIETLRGHAAVDPARIAVTGGSQGGGLALAAAGLVPDLSACLPDVPFLCHYRRATEITDSDPYGEIVRYLRVHRGSVDSVFDTLSYFDGVNFAARARAKALFSVALMDDICPPSTVYAAYNHYAGESKSITVYPYNRHEGGQSAHMAVKLKWLADTL